MKDKTNDSTIEVVPQDDLEAYTNGGMPGTEDIDVSIILSTQGQTLLDLLD